MNLTRRAVARFAVAALVAGLLVGLHGSPAWAATRCSTFKRSPNGVDGVMTCMVTSGNQGYGYIYREGRTPTSVTLYVRQCRSTNPPSACGTIAATHDEATGWLNLSIGHVYQACSSVRFPDGWKTVNQCSPFIAYP
jgi:hypothetical protein